MTDRQPRRLPHEMAIEREAPNRDTVMDVTEEQIARVYAKALLAAAAKSPDVAGLVEEVQSLADDVVAKFPALAETFRSSLISEESKEQLLDRVFASRASGTVLNFLKVLARHGRLQLLRPIARSLTAMYAEQRGLIDVEIRVASPLDEGIRQRIYERLKESLNAEPVFQIRIDPSIVAGIVIRAGDRVFDGSLETRLNLLRKTIIEGTVAKIESRPEMFLL
jgi:F-type H+-transporting ATPase subunit delta